MEVDFLQAMNQPRGTCHNCKKTGHWARDCPTKTSKPMGRGYAGGQTASRGGTSADKKCFRCGLQRHLKAACKVNLEKLKQRQQGQSGGQGRPQRVNQVQDGQTADGGSGGGGLEEDDLLIILGINSINEGGIHQGFRTRVAKGGLAARNQW